MKRQPPLVQAATDPDLPVQSPVAASPTKYDAPSAGLAGGSDLGGSSTAPATSASRVARLSLWVNSFCACPTLRKGSESRGVAAMPYSWGRLIVVCAGRDIAQSPI